VAVLLMSMLLLISRFQMETLNIRLLFIMSIHRQNQTITQTPLIQFFRFLKTMTKTKCSQHMDLVGLFLVILNKRMSDIALLWMETFSVLSVMELKEWWRRITTQSNKHLYMVQLTFQEF
jgi:hypothetical protein